jgi:hypothetical protein
VQKAARLAAEEARRAAEEDAAVQKAARLAAEEARRAAEEDAAVQKAARLIGARKAFESRMDNEAAPGPSATHVDTPTRRQDPTAEVKTVQLRDVIGEDLFQDQPSLAELAAWDAVVAFITDMKFPVSTAGSFEQKTVRVVMRCLLEVVARDCLWCRYWCDAMATDDVRVQAKPDHTFTDARDAQASMLGAVLMVEDKRPPASAKATSRLVYACAQATQYGRRRVQKLYYLGKDLGLDLRALSLVSTLVVGTDVQKLRVVRVMSGSPEVETADAYESAVPFQCRQSEALDLLPGFTGVGTGFEDGACVPTRPTAGFLALYRLLRVEGGSQNAAFASPAGSVLAELSVRLDATATDTHRVELGMRLGVGGSSDVYALASGLGVVKVPRHTSAPINDQFNAEVTALRMLADAGVRVPLGPKLVYKALSALFAGGKQWPVLMLDGPVGKSLVDAVRECDSEDARVALANKVVRAVLVTLRVAHERGLIHCDVRPANIVIDGHGEVYLVDWGVSREHGTPAASIGVRAYAVPGVFDNSESKYAASAAMDVYGALCTWIAIVHGGPAVEVPWITAPAKSVESARATWLGDNGELVGVPTVVKGLDADCPAYDYFPEDAAAVCAAAGAGAGAAH